MTVHEQLNHHEKQILKTSLSLNLTLALPAAVIMLGLQAACANHETNGARHAGGRSANELIGKKLVNTEDETTQDETLGKIHDILINVEAGTAPCAVIARGGALPRNKDLNDSRTFVRDPAPKGAQLLMTPADSALCEKVSSIRACETMECFPRNRNVEPHHDQWPKAVPVERGEGALSERGFF